MARRYAVIMGLVSLTVVLLRAFKNGGSLETAVFAGLSWMAIFAVLGGIVGTLAQTTIEDSIRVRIEADLRDIAAARAAGGHANATT
ncbi:MAG: hypothetical protein KF688_12715 [Pirellulales bacterium]|nr:hypothetical protein [Pirellulales bacterium]